MKKRLFSILLAMALLCACLPQVHTNAQEKSCMLAQGVELFKTYVIVADGQYAMTNRQEGPALHTYAGGATTTLASAPVTITDGVITSEITDDMLWTVCVSTAPEAWDGVTQYYLRDSDGNYLRRGSGSLGRGAQLLTQSELYSKLRFNTWSFYPYGDGTFVMYANSERSYGSDCPYYVYGNETSFDSPARLQRTEEDPFAFMYYDDCSRIQLFEAVGYGPCVHEYEPSVTPPTCTARGCTTWTCAKCGDSYVSDYVDELLHDWPAEGVVTTEPTETERGVLTFTCRRCGETKDRPLAAGNEKAHENEILFISDPHSGRKAEEGNHNLRAMFRLLREYDDFVPEVVAGGGDYLESRTFDDVDWPHCLEVQRDIMYETSPDTVQVLTSGNHEWEWSRQSDEMIERLLGSPRVGNNYSDDDFEIFQIGAHTNDGDPEVFLAEDIEKLRDFLESAAGCGKVIFIQTHWPLHYGYNSGEWRATENADMVIDLLNEYAESLDICFVWGHNHNEDAMRHRCLVSGDEMEYAKGMTKQIRFTYVNAGCLNEKHAKEGTVPENSQYGPGYLLEARITGDVLILDYGHITGAYPDPDEAVYDHDADLLYVENIQEARQSHHEIPLLHRGGCAHEYETAVTPPTCTEQGFTSHTCKKCGSSYIDTYTAALGHDLTAHEAKAPTCTEIGWTAYEACTRCDYTTYRELPAAGHQPGEPVRENEAAPTCTQKGRFDEVVSCAVCGAELRRTPTQTPALGHDFGEWTVTQTPACTQPGIRARTCSRCEAVETEAIEALGHDLTGYEAKPPTCTEIGWAAYEACTRCGYTTYRELPAAGHQPGEPVRENETAPTCTQKGRFDEVVFCTVCGAELRRTSVQTPALGHDFADGVCTRCGAADPHAPDDPFRFDDVRDENKFYFGPVYWAFCAKPQITNGVDATHFGPDNPCTRGHVVTFLWRAAGCPEPGSATTPFTDLKSGAFYEKAVAWAVEEGITKGVSDAAFDPDATCTRGQIVTFLWRATGSEEPKSTKTPFIDLKPGAFYEKAVAWAVELGVTKGMTDTTFVPDGTCTRGQVVTFLYRAAGET